MIECMNKLKNKQLFEGCSCLYEESSQWEKLTHSHATIIFILF